MILRGPKAPTDFDDTEAWAEYDRKWFWHNVRWYCFCAFMVVYAPFQIWLLYVVVTQ